MTNEQATPFPYKHWMLREMHEQPETLAATLKHYVEGGAFREETCAPVRAWLKETEHEAVVVASGSSRHAGMVAELWLEDISALPVDVEYASEYMYRSGKSLKNASVLVVSQSGETADTLAALRKAKSMGRPTLAITNVQASSMAQVAMASFPVLAGRERAVPATKSFTAQLLNLYLLALMAAEGRNALSAAQIGERLAELESLSGLVREQMADWERDVRAVAAEYGDAKSFLFLGRGVHYAIAREGALKLKESAYLHAEGYPAGELKHGPNALVSDSTPLVMVATVDHGDAESVERYGKVLQLMRDMRVQGANILAIANEGDAAVEATATNTIFVKPAREALMAISEVIPLQMFSYFMAINAGIDVDHPRNLSKAVLAE
jgi:glucosamine--fructose-6-phosphate aminotransferase (isomerizing)